MTSASSLPDLSIILPTDCFATIETVLQHLVRQTIARRIELIVVTTSSKDAAPIESYAEHFFSLRILETPVLSPLGIPRAVGLRVARARLIFVGETHSYLHPDAAEKLVAAAADDRWSVIVPGFVNANPTGIRSWAGFLMAYGRWSASLPAQEIPEAPLYDAIYRRDAIVSIDNFEAMLSGGDDALAHAMRARGDRVYLESSARLAHLNVDLPRVWIYEHYLLGVMIGARRAREWPFWRRLFYIAAAWLIPFVLLARAGPGLWRSLRNEVVPFGTLPVIFFILVIRAIGEIVGYAGFSREEEQNKMTACEIRRLDYVSGPISCDWIRS